MSKFEKWAKRSETEAKLAKLSNKAWHSTFYHGQFEGYSEYYELDRNGKTHLRRVYTAHHYRPTLTKKQQRQLRFLRPLLFVISVALFIVSAAWNAICNTTVYVTLLQAVIILALAITLIGIISHLTVFGDLKISDYKHTVERVKHWSLFGSVLLFIEASASLVSAFLGKSFDPGSTFCALLSLLSGGVLLALNRVEASVEYQIIDSSVPEPPGSFQI